MDKSKALFFRVVAEPTAFRLCPGRSWVGRNWGRMPMPLGAQERERARDRWGSPSSVSSYPWCRSPVPVTGESVLLPFFLP